MIKEFKFNAGENKIYKEGLTDLGRIINTVEVLKNAIYSNLVRLDHSIVNNSVGAIMPTGFVYKNIHGMDIQTDLLEKLQYNKTNSLNIYIQNDFISLEYKIGMEITTIPANPDLKTDDDMLALSLRIAFPSGVFEWCRENNFNPLVVYGEVAAQIQSDLLSNFLPKFDDTYQFSGTIGSEDE